MSKEQEDEILPDNEVISTKQRIAIKHEGGSHFLRVPADWKNSFPGLERISHLVFEAHVEKTPYGKLLLVFTPIREEVNSR